MRYKAILSFDLIDRDGEERSVEKDDLEESIKFQLEAEEAKRVYGDEVFFLHVKAQVSAIE